MLFLGTPRDIPHLRPVELYLLRLHALHPIAQVVRDADGVWVGLEVMHCDGDGEVGGEEQAKAEAVSFCYHPGSIHTEERAT